VALTNVVVRLAPFQRTREAGTKPLPLTVSVRAPLPAETLAGDSPLTVGTAERAAALTEKVAAPEVPPPGAGVTTVTGTERALARSAAVIAARSWVALTNVVVRLAPFQRTREAGTKPLPLTVSVSGGLPAVALAGPRLLTLGTGERAGAVTANVAVTVVAVFTVTVQAPVPLQAPLQPAKFEPETALAVSAIRVPAGTVWVQSEPHAIPAGELVTVPVPVPFLVTDRVAVALLVVEPLTPRETVSPPAVKVTLPAKLPAVVGRNRTVMVRLAPEASEKEAPETILNGAPTLAAPEMLALPVFRTVNVRSTVPPTATLPKPVEAAGATSRSAWATPLAELEHPLSLPLVSRAVMRTK
jgi:hypothetical protein